MPILPTASTSAANLRTHAGWGRFLLAAGLAVASAVLLALAFPPVEAGILAWVALVPLLAAPVPVTPWRRVAIGYLFGYAYFAVNLFWLNTIGFAAGFLLALICACFPLAWYLFAAELLRRLPGGTVRTRANPATPRKLWELPPLSQCVWTLAVAAAWVAQEWVRSWIFTGFSWNQLGVSQWSQTTLLPLATVTGVYGISFLIVAGNVALFASWARITRAFSGVRGGISWPMLMVLLLFVPVILLLRNQPPPPSLRDAAALRAAVAQGCIPQCREWRQEQLDDSLAAYTTLSRFAAGQQPDLIVWPETAIPAGFSNPQYAAARAKLVADIKIPLLIGCVDYRPAVAKPDPYNESDWLTFNSALLLDQDGKRLQSYDKTHPVPFGEYTPFAKYLPWLEKWIGMGRGLTAGREFTIFNLPGGVKAGTMICYEDAYPGIARQFTLRGADLLITLTNDAWYAESAGSRQHLLHAVCRAVENRRPLLRAGNNSDSCLITPKGKIENLLTDPVTGHRFVRGVRVYEITVWHNQPLTFYARHGDLFAQLCAACTAAGLLWLGYGHWRRKHALLTKIAPETKAV